MIGADLTAKFNDRVVLLVSTHRGAARFVPLVREALAEFWPGHPPLRFLTDGGAGGPDVITGESRAFVPLMAEGLARVAAEFPSATHVFHMLEDHCPLRACDVARIENVTAEAVTGRLAAIAFVTYDWPWSHTTGAELPDGLGYGMYRIDPVRFGNETFAAVPKTFFRYFQVQPTLWRIDYLRSVTAAAIDLGAIDPWSFEALQYPGAEQHYVSSYRWPTVHHGFLAQGKVHNAAIDFADRRAPVAIRRSLIREATGFDSEAAYRLHKARVSLMGLGSRFKNSLGGIAGRPRGR